MYHFPRNRTIVADFALIDLIYEWWCLFVTIIVVNIINFSAQFLQTFTTLQQADSFRCGAHMYAAGFRNNKMKPPSEIWQGLKSPEGLPYARRPISNAKRNNIPFYDPKRIA